jgi:hypothetical protein
MAKAVSCLVPRMIHISLLSPGISYWIVPKILDPAQRRKIL